MKTSKNKGKRGRKHRELLVGVEAIAAYLGQPRRRVQYWANTRAIPLQKQGALWCATRTALKRHFTGEPAADAT